MENEIKHLILFGHLAGEVEQIHGDQKKKINSQSQIIGMECLRLLVSLVLYI